MKRTISLLLAVTLLLSACTSSVTVSDTSSSPNTAISDTPTSSTGEESGITSEAQIEATSNS